jgi:hypothetical protein
MAQLQAGMRNNNPGNIKYIGQAGTRPSVNTDQGDPQAVFASPEAGMAAMASLLRRKYTGGKRTANQIIAGEGGWTPGNVQAAANVAATAGISPDDDIMFSDPAAAARFMRALVRQEHGPASDAYTDAMITAAISGVGAAPTSGLAALMAPADAAGVQSFAPPAFGDVVAADDPLAGLGLGFIKRAEARRAAEDEREQERRRALFSQPVAPTGGLGGLYG